MRPLRVAGDQASESEGVSWQGRQIVQSCLDLGDRSPWSTTSALRLPSRPELPFHDQVDLNGALAEPGAVPFRENRWLGDLGHSEHGSVEVPHVTLPTWGHGALYMADALEGRRLGGPTLPYGSMFPRVVAFIASS